MFEDFKNTFAEELLPEFVDTNGNKINLNNSTASTSQNISTPAAQVKNNLDQTERYKKLLAKIDSEKNYTYKLKDLSSRILAFVIDFGKSDYVYIRIIFSPRNQTYLVQVVGDDDYRYDSWDEVLKLLVSIRVIKNTYNCESLEDEFSEENILTEFVDAKGNKVNLPKASSKPASSSSSKTNKEKFKELTDYMIKNKSSSVYKAEVVRLDEGGFTYKEHRKSSSGQDFTFTLLVGYSRFGPQWKYELYIDTELEEERSGNGFNYLLFELYKHFKVPSPGSPEHDSICESASFADDFKLYENLWD